MNFGTMIREQRTKKGHSVRGLAKLVDVSPSYLSRIETGAFPPPAEDKIKELAKELDLNSDLLLAAAKKVSSDLTDLIMNDPVRMADVIRTSAGASAHVSFNAPIKTKSST